MSKFLNIKNYPSNKKFSETEYIRLPFTFYIVYVSSLLFKKLLLRKNYFNNTIINDNGDNDNYKTINFGKILKHKKLPSKFEV